MYTDIRRTEQMKSGMVERKFENHDKRESGTGKTNSTKRKTRQRNVQMKGDRKNNAKSGPNITSSVGGKKRKGTPRYGRNAPGCKKWNIMEMGQVKR